MTTAELITMLQAMPQDLPVWSYDNDIEPIYAPVTVECVTTRDADIWFPAAVVIRGDVGAR